ncbi:MAG: hypothetical protein K2H73_10075 [Treponemataceae bacterium]|nr:hypothetical protein [Treponemataceae bacterium]
MKKIIYTCVILLGVMLIPSCIDTPKIESIRFIDDRTIEYENEFSLGVGDYGYSGYDVKLLSLNPNNGAYVKRNMHTSTKGKIYFSKDIPDGTIVKLEFLYSGKNERAFIYTVVKGE